MKTEMAIATVVVVALITSLLRFLPFIVFGEKRKTPKIIDYLGKFLPFSIMGMLVVYCLKDVSLTAAPFGIPELIAGASVVLLHLWKRNTLLSIGAGTILYMLMIQLIFL
ncbi:MAG: branched-chain amino acid transporter permease [Clostridia bacterium]|nr:branched-chain amino acid transporter permease [Clostridia bacterium]